MRVLTENEVKVNKPELLKYVLGNLISVILLISLGIVLPITLLFGIFYIGFGIAKIIIGLVAYFSGE